MNQYNSREGLGKKEALVLSELASEGKAIFTIDDLREKCENPANVAHNLSRKRWILHLKRGLYMIADLPYGKRGADAASPHSFVIAAHLARYYGLERYYIGFWSALNYHGLSDQVPRTVFIVSTDWKNAVNVLNNRFEFVEVPSYKVRGLEKIEVGGENVMISTKEKTIADCLDRPEYCGGIDEVARALYLNRDMIDPEMLKVYIKWNENNAAVKRALYITKTLRLAEIAAVLSDMKLKSGYPLLDPTEPNKGKHSKEFGLLINKKLDPERWMF